MPEGTNKAKGDSTSPLLAFGIAACVPFKRPLDVAHYAFSSLQQLFSRITGTGFRPERDVGDQAGKVILVTGGNTGLGKQTILQLAKHKPARIYLAARNESKGNEAIESIQSTLREQQEGLDVDIRYLPLDLASFESIHGAAQQFTSGCDRLDTLILNAGVMAVPFSTTEEGYEIQFGTNHVGHFLFTKLLLSTLRRTAAEKTTTTSGPTEPTASTSSAAAAAATAADVRVVVVSSMAWQVAPRSVSKSLSLMTSTAALSEVTTLRRYGASKAANILFAAELARRYPELTAVSLHPGVIFTGLYDTVSGSNAIIKLVMKILRFFAMGEEDGAMNHLWAAGADKKQVTNGDYYTPVGRQGWKNEYVHDVGAGKKLWEWTDEQVDESGK